MNGTRWFLASVSVVGCIALIWSIDWVVEQFSPEDHPSRVAYTPDEDIAPVDLASIQRGWPSNLDDPGVRNRMMAHLNDTKGTVPRPTASAAGPAKAETPPDLGTLLANATAAEGEGKARACVSCHDFTSGGPDRIGPNLWNVVGRDIGGKQGFSYSGAMNAQPGGWTYEYLFEYLASPARSMPGTKMTFAGLRRPEDRAAVIKYLATLGANPPPFPQPQPPAEDVADAEVAQ
ncbi:MAG: cytochrome c family protein [Sphingomonadaceae bacterium]|nr:cytochrome c family protein [Sphingomonadaceae bacterium]